MIIIIKNYRRRRRRLSAKIISRTKTLDDLQTSNNVTYSTNNKVGQGHEVRGFVKNEIS